MNQKEVLITKLYLILDDIAPVSTNIKELIKLINTEEFDDADSVFETLFKYKNTDYLNKRIFNAYKEYLSLKDKNQ